MCQSQIFVGGFLEQGKSKVLDKLEWLNFVLVQGKGAQTFCLVVSRM